MRLPVITTIVLIGFLSTLFSSPVLATFSSITSLNPLMLLRASNRSFSDRECTMCRFSVGLVNYALDTNRGSEQIYKIANTFCSLAHLETPVVCSKISKVFNREIVKVLRNGILTPKQVCGLISKNTCGQFDDPMTDWEVHLNASTTLDQDELVRIQKYKSLASDNQNSLATEQPYRVIHISDTHVDLRYKEGSLATCAEPLCCQETSTPSNSTSDDLKAGTWGSYASCDVPLKTFDSALKTIKSLIESNSSDTKIDYIVWTGDIQPHDVWNQDRKTAIATYEAVFSKILQLLPDVKIFPTFGNHEMVPVDSFSPSNLLSIAREDSPEWVYKKIDSYWSRWLPAETVKTITKDGFYAANVRPGLKVISLNTNFCHDKNFWLFINATDPGNQLQWLIHELQISELQQEQVHIIGHIPPGAGDCLKVWSKNFNRIVRRFSNTIGGQFYGHTHFNEFELFYDFDGTKKVKSAQRALVSEEGKVTTDASQLAKTADRQQSQLETWQPTSVGWIGPSVTTFIKLNPAFRIYTIDPNQGYMPIDMETYYMNLTAANAAGPNHEPQWQSSGFFSYLFGVNDTSPMSMHQLLVEIVNEIHEEDNSILADETPLYQRLFPFNPSEKYVDQNSKLYKLYRLYNSYSDVLQTTDFNKINKKEFLCPFFTGQSHNSQACNKFIYGSLGFNEIANN